MGAYILRRVLLIVPTLFGVMVVNFIIVQFAPGGPIEQILAQATGVNISTTAAVSAGVIGPAAGDAVYEGATGIDPDLIAELKIQFGFDKPTHERFFLMIWNYMRLDLGDSYFQDRPVIDLVIERMPISISLGLWSMLLIYMISIPLGVGKAIRDGTGFDAWTSGVVFAAYAIPGFLFAVMLIVVFAGGSYFDWFPLRGLVSENFNDLSVAARIKDYFWHLALPITALTIGGFATLTMLTKNSFLEEINKQFVLTARAKGLT